MQEFQLAFSFLWSSPFAGYFNNRILFLTVSQSPNVEQLRAKVWGFVSGCDSTGPNYVTPLWNLQIQSRLGAGCLVVLDDVWSLAVLEQLIFRVPGCKTLVVSRFRFPTVLNATYEVELLTEDESLSLFCHSAFGQKTIPHAANENLVKQVISNSRFVAWKLSERYLVPVTGSFLLLYVSDSCEIFVQ